MGIKKELLNIIKLVESLRSSQKLSDFFVGILTPQEIEIIATRIEIVRMLKKNVPQKDIADKLGVGIATVTRGSRELKRGRFHYV